MRPDDYRRTWAARPRARWAWPQALLVAMLVLATVAAPRSVQALPDYPGHQITMIVPFAAGGPTDVVARLVAERMSQTLGQQVVIENIIGAGGTTAGTRTMRASPDGYTIMMGHMGTHGAAVALYPKLAYNPAKDFEPIGLVTKTPVFIVSKANLPVVDLAGFVAYSSEHASEMTMGHAGMGSVSHVSCQLFNALVSISPKLAAFQGSGPAMSALAAGKIDYMCDVVVSVVPQALAKSIHVYAVASPVRNAALPDVPTAAEAGMSKFEVLAWNALFAPKGTPNSVLTRLNAALGFALVDAGVRKRLLELGCDIPDANGRSPAALSSVVEEEIRKWQPVLKPTLASQ